MSVGMGRSDVNVSTVTPPPPTRGRLAVRLPACPPAHQHNVPPYPSHRSAPPLHSVTLPPPTDGGVGPPLQFVHLAVQGVGDVCKPDFQGAQLVGGINVERGEISAPPPGIGR